MSSRYCNNCGRINPAENHPLGGCTCPRPDFTVRPSAGEQIRSLEDQLATLRSEVAYVRGHLEGYEPAIRLRLQHGETEADILPLLLDDLREDARRLEKLGGHGA